MDWAVCLSQRSRSCGCTQSLILTAPVRVPDQRSGRSPLSAQEALGESVRLKLVVEGFQCSTRSHSEYIRT